jgi:hypothetical protein
MPSRKVLGETLAVLLGLKLDASQGEAYRLGLHDASAFAVHVKQVVRFAVAGLEGEFPHSDTPAGIQVKAM